jgi:outer membrane receptor protein involved in Fe transport
MTFRSVFLRGAVVGVALFALSPLAKAQVTTGSIAGVVVGDQQQPIEDAQIQVVNRSTGFSVGVRSNATGRYTVPGLEVGSAYAITVRRIGYQPETRENIRVSLSQATPVNFALVTQATVLGEVTTVASRDALISPTRQGVATSVSDTALRRLPTLNRNFTDFVALTPQVSSAGPGLSGGGTNNRYNNIQIDGATEADLFGLGSTGQPGGQAGGKSIGIESVKEYQVLLTPFDVRQGNFAGLLINAVTKSGTNEYHGSVIASTRNQGFTRSQPYINKYEQTQYGVSVGGPIIKDRAFFFINPEFQQRTTPAGGMYIGGPVSPTAPPTQTRLDSINTYLRSFGLPSGGGSLANNNNPLHNIFGRVDINLPRGSQLVLRHNYGYAEDDNLSRSASSFRLDNNAYFFQSTKNSSVAQLRTLFGSGMYNELMVNRTAIRDRRTPVAGRTPEIQVVTTGYTFFSGAENASQNNELDQDILEITDNFTIPVGAHRFTVGTQNQFYKVRNLFGQYSFGGWRFASVDSLRTGTPNQYIIGVPLQGDGAVRFRAAQYAVYAQDEWAVTPTLNLTLGLRADIPTFRDKPSFNQTIFNTFQRSTSEVPSGNVQWSPRVGFNWNATGDDVNQVRGGIGLFTGRPAFVWLSNAFQNSGSNGFARLTCNATPNPPQGVPAFNTGAIANPPRQCAGGLTAQAGGEINLADPDLKFPQNLRGTLGYDRRLAQNWVATIEGLYTRGINGLFYQNIALAGPQGRDVQGRTIYGAPAATPTGNGTPVVRVAGRTQVFDVTNQSKDYAYQLTGQLQRRFADNYEGSVAYTYGRAFDVQSFTSSTAFSQYRFGRPWGGDQSDKVATRSIFEQRHRIVAQGTYSFPTKTDVTLIYFGESGNPYDYTANADLNGDGITRNDPLYIPRNARDATEFPLVAQTYSGVAYTAAQQADAFERFIEDTPCLKENRGRIVPRNACENPWSNELNVSLRQSLPQLWAQNVSLQLDVFNFLNLLNKEWGAQASGGTQSPYDLLDPRGRTTPATAPATFFNTIPTWSFNPTYQKFLSNNLQSNYQIQFQIRYSF